MKLLTSLAALAVGLSVAAAAPAPNKAVDPVKLTKVQLDKIVAGNPNRGPNGSIDGSNGASGAPGNSWGGGGGGGDGNGSPGHTNNPHPGK